MKFSKSAHNETGSIVGLLVTFVFLILILTVLVFFVFGKIVPPNMIGVRQNYFSLLGMLEEGYVAKGLQPGLHWKVPFVSDVQLLPRDFQFVQLDSNDLSGDLSLNYLEIPTADGSKVETDLTLVLRFFEKPGKSKSAGVRWKDTEVTDDTSDVPILQRVEREHGGPKNLVNTYGIDRNYQLKTFVGKGEESIKRWLSSLSTIDYYNPSMREKAALKASESINSFSNKEGIELWATLVRRYTYSEQKIDDQIFAKNLQDATERLNSAKSELAKARAKTEEVGAYWDGQKIAVLKEEGSAKVRVLDEQAKSYEAEQKARADKLIELAYAEVEKAKNEALSSKGGDIYVARKLVPILKSLSGGVVRNVDPYDVDAWVKKLVGSRNEQSEGVTSNEIKSYR